MVLGRPIIEEIHKMLVADLGVTENLRSVAVGITGTNYKPLDNVCQIAEALDAMITLINEKEDFFEKAFLALVLLAYIQPFEDGNKRTARTVSNAVLFAHGTTPLSYRAASEVEYKKANLIFYETNNLAWLKDIFIKQFTFAVEKYF
jgi:Fic family protein